MQGEDSDEVLVVVLWLFVRTDGAVAEQEKQSVVVVVVVTKFASFEILALLEMVAEKTMAAMVRVAMVTIMAMTMQAILVAIQPKVVVEVVDLPLLAHHCCCYCPRLCCCHPNKEPRRS